MKKYFIFSDVHGCYDALMNALYQSGFDFTNEEHCIISLGDNFDRGKQNYKVFRFLSNFPKERKVLIKGNHEVLLEEMVRRFDVMPHDIANGTKDAYLEFRRELNDRFIQEVIDFMKPMPFYHEINDLIFTHGFLPDDYKNASVQDWLEAIWIDSQARLNDLPDIDKTIVVGHVGTRYFHSRFDIFISDANKCKLIALDASVNMSKKVNILVVDEEGKIENKQMGTVLRATTVEKTSL